MKQQAILDFSDDGKAVVQIPDVGKMAFINTFGLSKISEVEKDIEEADTAEISATCSRASTTCSATAIPATTVITSLPAT